MVNPDHPIDYSTLEGIKTFQKATTSVYPDGLLNILQQEKNKIGKSGNQHNPSSKTVRFAQSLSAIAEDVDEE